MPGGAYGEEEALGQGVCVCSVTQLCPTLRPHGLQPSSLLCPWDFSGRNTGVGCHFLLQGIFLIQRSKLRLLHLLHWQMDSLPLSHLGSSLARGAGHQMLQKLQRDAN